jgi:ubiquinone biosynthesis monooxygenase Coq7
VAHGGAELPGPIKLAMKLASRVMTRSAYWI